MFHPTNSLTNFLATFLIACLAPGIVTVWSGTAQAGDRIVYTRHSVTVDTHDLDFSREADRRVFRARVASAADEVCGERPDKTNRYGIGELSLLMPAYDKCRRDAIERTVTLVNTMTGTRLIAADSRPQP